MEIDTEYMAKLSSVIDTLYQAGADNVVVAGGAIRDMLFNKPIKDIDVFYTGFLDTAYLKEKYLSVIPCDVKYEDSEFTISHEIISTNIFPCWIQLVQLKGNILDTINKFPTAVGRAYYDSESLGGITAELIQAEQNKIIWFDQPCNMKYYQKYVDKYSEYFLKFRSENFRPPELSKTITFPLPKFIYDDSISTTFTGTSPFNAYITT